MNKIEKLYLKVNAMAIFDGFPDTPVGTALCNCLKYAFEDWDYSHEEVIRGYAALCSCLYEQEGDLGLFVKEYIRSGDNLYMEKFLIGDISDEMEDALEAELKTLQEIASLKSEDLIKALRTKYDGEIPFEELELPKWKNTRISAKTEFANSLKYIYTKGYGLFLDTYMFKVRDGQLIPVFDADYQTLDQLYGYDRERNLVLQNTEALAMGSPASNVLLYGDAGTGKSTTVKACAAYYGELGVRLIEFDKNQVQEIPEFAEELSWSPLKFIFFIDDLTFTENDDDYYALKGILEGNVSGTAPNILIYATSNRRHLVKESAADRQGDDIHLNDTLQETMSLSSRFGLTVTFSKPAKDLYLSIVESMAIEQGLVKNKDDKALDDLLTRAEAFAIRSNGRSPRTAKQFIVLAKNGLR